MWGAVLRLIELGVKVPLRGVRPPMAWDLSRVERLRECVLGPGVGLWAVGSRAEGPGCIQDLGLGLGGQPGEVTLGEHGPRAVQTEPL
jgi:hypothetical protein